MQTATGGWKPFGNKRKVTKSEGSVVYEIDGERALDIYSKYLGEEAEDLPSSGLLYPIELVDCEDDTGIIRTLLGIDNETGSLTFAGDVPENSTIRLMHASFDELCTGAEDAAETTVKEISNAEFGFLVSCVGRKLVMGELTNLELEAVNGKLGSDLPLTGFYSYGEIAPNQFISSCKLHNQSMTVILMSESD